MWHHSRGVIPSSFHVQCDPPTIALTTSSSQGRDGTRQEKGRKNSGNIGRFSAIFRIEGGGARYMPREQAVKK